MPQAQPRDGPQGHGPAAEAAHRPDSAARVPGGVDVWSWKERAEQLCPCPLRARGPACILPHPPAPVPGVLRMVVWAPARLWPGPAHSLSTAHRALSSPLPRPPARLGPSIGGAPRGPIRGGGVTSGNRNPNSHQDQGPSPFLMPPLLCWGWVKSAWPQATLVVGREPLKGVLGRDAGKQGAGPCGLRAGEQQANAPGPPELGYLARAVPHVRRWP